MCHISHKKRTVPQTRKARRILQGTTWQPLIYCTGNLIWGTEMNCRIRIIDARTIGREKARGTHGRYTGNVISNSQGRKNVRGDLRRMHRERRRGSTRKPRMNVRGCVWRNTRSMNVRRTKQGIHDFQHKYLAFVEMPLIKKEVILTSNFKNVIEQLFQSIRNGFYELID